MRRHNYSVNVKWTGTRGKGTSAYNEYDRSHTISTDGKVEIKCSSDPAFQGDSSKYNPEELFIFSLSTCHMLWYLHLCADAGIIVVDYFDKAEGIMIEGPDVQGHFESVTLKPIIVITSEAKMKEAMSIHEEANQKCFIANSCNFPIRHKPVIKIAGEAMHT